MLPPGLEELAAPASGRLQDGDAELDGRRIGRFRIVQEPPQVAAFLPGEQVLARLGLESDEGPRLEPHRGACGDDPLGDCVLEKLLREVQYLQRGAVMLLPPVDAFDDRADIGGGHLAHLPPQVVLLHEGDEMVSQELEAVLRINPPLLQDLLGEDVDEVLDGDVLRHLVEVGVRQAATFCRRGFLLRHGLVDDADEGGGVLRLLDDAAVPAAQFPKSTPSSVGLPPAEDDVARGRATSSQARMTIDGDLEPLPCLAGARQTGVDHHDRLVLECDPYLLAPHVASSCNWLRI